MFGSVKILISILFSFSSLFINQPRMNRVQAISLIERGLNTFRQTNAATQVSVGTCVDLGLQSSGMTVNEVERLSIAKELTRGGLCRGVNCSQWNQSLLDFEGVYFVTSQNAATRKINYGTRRDGRDINLVKHIPQNCLDDGGGAITVMHSSKRKANELVPHSDENANRNSGGGVSLGSRGGRVDHGMVECVDGGSRSPGLLFSQCEIPPSDRIVQTLLFPVTPAHRSSSVLVCAGSSVPISSSACTPKSVLPTLCPGLFQKTAKCVKTYNDLMDPLCALPPLVSYFDNAFRDSKCKSSMPLEGGKPRCQFCQSRQSNWGSGIKKKRSGLPLCFESAELNKITCAEVKEFVQDPLNNLVVQSLISNDKQSFSSPEFATLATMARSFGLRKSDWPISFSIPSLIGSSLSATSKYLLWVCAGVKMTDLGPTAVDFPSFPLEPSAQFNTFNSVAFARECTNCTVRRYNLVTPAR
jgi:hypothetical protein